MMRKLFVLTSRAVALLAKGDEDPREIVPPGLLLSLGDGRAVEVTAEMLAAARQGDVWRHASQAVREDTIEMAQKWIDRLIQQAQEADRAE